MAVSSGHRSLLKARTFSPAQNLLSPNDDASGARVLRRIIRQTCNLCRCTLRVCEDSSLFEADFSISSRRKPRGGHGCHFRRGKAGAALMARGSRRIAFREEEASAASVEA